MAEALNCRLAATHAAYAKPFPIPNLPQFIGSWIFAGSHGDISLTIPPPFPLDSLHPPGFPITALELHERVLEVNQNPPSGPVSNICVLYSGRYAGLPGAFGIMFDRGFTTPDDNQSNFPIFMDHPRQGCAVFLDTIADHRPDPSAYLDEVMFASVHEVGHIFNLQHDETCFNFMKTSDLNAGYGPQAFLFTPLEQTLLSSCSTNPDVAPGQSPFGSGAATNLPDRRSGNPVRNLKLRLSCGKSRAWRFEPIQITLEVSTDTPEETPLPLIFDPASQHFRLMIENDLGERRLYRPPVRTCGPVTTAPISAASPYRRDFPVFGQSGGYTFRRAGVHYLFAEATLNGERLRSNRLRIEVRPELELSTDQARYRKVMGHRDVASLLFHREDRKNLAAVHKLAQYIRVNPDVPSSGEIRYALARAITKHRSRPDAPPYVEAPDCKALLSAALASDDLDDHRRERALQLLS